MTRLKPTSMPLLTDTIQAKIKRDLVKLLYEQSSRACLIIVIGAAAAAQITTNFQPGPGVLIWWLLITLLMIGRLVQGRWWLRNIAPTQFNGVLEIKRFAILSLLSGAMFGAFPIVAYSELDYLGRVGVILILAGLAGGASTVLAANRWLALAYISLLLLPPCLLALWRPNNELVWVGVLGLLYWGILSVAAYQSSRFIYQAAKVRHHNEELVTAIAEEKRLVETSNQKLQRAYAKINSVNEILEEKVQDRTKALEVLASTDDLTGLKNRHTFVKTLNGAIENAGKTGKRFSIFFIDLDGFKEINDIRGHMVGDQVLQTIAKRLQLSVKNKDFLCRWGGDEFVLIIEESESRLLERVSARVCRSVQQPINSEFDNIKITVSIGISIYPIHGSTSAELVNAADVAMYELKRNGRGGTMMFQPAFLEKIRFKQYLLNGLSKALDSNQLDLHYQPILPCDATKSIVFESLIRWKHEGNYISPSVFIPIAESCNSIFDIGTWVLKRACGDLYENKLGPNSRVSVNISVRQLLSPYFVNLVKRCLEEFQLESWRLQIEVTETVFAKSLQHASIVLSQLRDLGVKIALDDFGSGFSSLAYLQSLPIDTIKIDQCFVKQIDNGGEQIIEATLSIAKAFGCNIVAEGVEHEPQKIRLQKLGVDYLQGFYIAKPTPYYEVDQRWTCAAVAES